jgi:hypothetical protein
MTSPGNILGGSARFEILRALHYQHDAVGLRHVARLAGVHPHSAERMLKALVDEGVVVRSRTRTRTWFQPNHDHADWRILSPVFEAADRATRELQAESLTGRAKTILPFVEEAGAMLKKARKRTHVA